MEEKKALRERCQEDWNRHKKKIIIAGAVVIGVAVGSSLIRNWDDLLEQVSKLSGEKILPEIAAEKVPEIMSEPVAEIIRVTREVTVDPHIMKLSAGKKASETAKAFAAEAGVELYEGVTWRRGSTRNIAA